MKLSSALSRKTFDYKFSDNKFSMLTKKIATGWRREQLEIIWFSCKSEQWIRACGMRIVLESNSNLSVQWPEWQQRADDKKKKKKGKESTMLKKKNCRVTQADEVKFCEASPFSCSSPFVHWIYTRARTLYVGIADDFLGDCAKAAGCELLALSFPLRVRGNRGVFFCLSTPTSSR